MFKRIILALLFSVNLQALDIPILSFSWTIGEGLKDISMKLCSLPAPAKVIVGCGVVVGVVAGMYFAGKKDDKLPTVDRCPNGEYLYKKPKHWVNPDLPRENNNKGGYIDDNGDAWEYDPIKNEWDVQIRRSRGGRSKDDHINVNTEGIITHPKLPKPKKCDFSVGIRDGRDLDIRCGTDKFNK